MDGYIDESSIFIITVCLEKSDALKCTFKVET